MSAAERSRVSIWRGVRALLAWLRRFKVLRLGGERPKAAEPAISLIGGAGYLIQLRLEPAPELGSSPRACRRPGSSSW
jgi:hypothetical protein